MSFLLRNAPAEHHGWLCSRIEYSPTVQFRALEVVDATGRIRGMVGLDGWTPASVQMCIALETPIAARALLRPSFDWVFNQEGKDVAFALVSSANQEALDFDRSLGFRTVGRLLGAHSKGIDLVILEMRRADCRWLPRAHVAREKVHAHV